MKNDKIFNRLGIPFIKRGEITLVPKGNVLKAIEILQNNGYKLLGFDAIILTEKTIQPSMNYSKDYTSITYNKDLSNAYIPTKSEIENFFVTVPTEITHFEIVFNY